jgi:WD40 repeat protein
MTMYYGPRMAVKPYDSLYLNQVSAFSPDRLKYAVGKEDGTIEIWNSTTGDLITVLRAYTGAVTSLTFSPGGWQLASGTSDGRVMVWDMVKRILIHSFKVPVKSITFSPDGLKLYAQSNVTFDMGTG